MSRSQGRRHVFVSYSRADAAFVRPIVKRLERAGHDAWVDSDDLAAGTSWTGQIAQAIGRSDALVVVLTTASVRSPEVVREVHLAASKRVPMIPVEVAPVRIPQELEYPLSGLQSIRVADDQALTAAARVVDAVERGIPDISRVRGARRLAGALVALCVVGVVGLGVATVVTGAFPPWAPQASCDDVAMRVQPGQPASDPFRSGASFPVDLVNEGTRTVRIPGSGAVTVVSQDGFQYDVEQLPSLGDWWQGFEIQPSATVRRQLGVEAPVTRSGPDRVTVSVPSIAEGALPILRCQVTQEDVAVTVAG